MPGIYEADQVGQVQEITDIVFNVRADETPFMSMIPKDKKPSRKVATWQVENYADVSINGVMDGADVTSYDHQGRELLSGVAQKFRVPWMVSDFADVTEVAGLPKGEKGRQKVVAAKRLAFAMEGRFLSNEECSTDDGGSTPNETRGALLWLDDEEQDVLPVPAAFRPGSDVTHEDTLANLTESTFEGLLESAYEDRNGTVNLDGFVGIQLKGHMANWTVRDSEASASAYPVRTWNQNAEKKKMIKVVDVFQFSAGTVRLHPSAYLRRDADGSTTSYTHRSGAFLDLSMWALAFLGNRRPRMVESQDLGGGPRGWSDAIAVLKCRNPLGHVRTMSSS